MPHFRRAYTLSFAGLLILSAYPLYMLGRVLFQLGATGQIPAEAYSKYIIPYAPFCLSLIACWCFIPLLVKKGERWGLTVLSGIGLVVFFAFELGLERLPVAEETVVYRLLGWQYGPCFTTPAVLVAMGQPLYAQNNPLFKLHFYLIMGVLLLAVLSTACGFFKMLLNRDFRRKKPLILQSVSVAVLLGLCILACFTAFFRNGSLWLSPLSAILTGGFFALLGVTAGAYTGGFLYGKRPLAAILLPSLAAAIITAAMYGGELLLMGGVLFQLGPGPFFAPLGWSIPFSLADLCLILLSGLLTALLLYLVNRPICRKETDL
jgi:hypothetical protein